MGLPLKHRLKKRQDFKAVYQRGGRYSSPLMTIRTLSESSPQGENPNPPSCFGISVSLKVSKKAVIRNRIKRHIRRAIAALLGDISPGWKVVIIVRPGSIECKYEHFLRELRQLLVQAEIINGH